MKKIITVYDVLDAPWHVLSFAIKIAKEENIPITGIFLAGHSKSGQNYLFPNDMMQTADKLSNETISRENALLIDDNIQLFKTECAVAGVACEIRKEVLIKDLIEEIGTDLIVADTRSGFLDELLPKVSGPVCLTSENALPQKVVLMLDENIASRNAIEKFALLFPQFTSLPSTVVSINLNDEQQSSNETYFKQTLQAQFSSINKIILEGNMEKELLKFLSQDTGNIIVVMGAFGRSGVSRFFHDSLANLVLDQTRVSLFIVHK